MSKVLSSVSDIATNKKIMLVLTRKSGESINISDEIKITVLEIKGNQVKLGINAPGNVIIHREEIYQKIKEENLIAASLEIERFRKALSQIKKLTG